MSPLLPTRGRSGSARRGLRRRGRRQCTVDTGFVVLKDPSREGARTTGGCEGRDWSRGSYGRPRSTVAGCPEWTVAGTTVSARPWSLGTPGRRRRPPGPSAGVSRGAPGGTGPPRHPTSRRPPVCQSGVGGGGVGFGLSGGWVSLAGFTVLLSPGLRQVRVVTSGPVTSASVCERVPRTTRDTGRGRGTTSGPPGFSVPPGTPSSKQWFTPLRPGSVW